MDHAHPANSAAGAERAELVDASYRHVASRRLRAELDARGEE